MENTSAKTHYLKCQLVFFESVLSGKKNFELRKNDRPFSVGDLLVLQEYDMYNQKYTGRKCYREIVYMLSDQPQFGLQIGYCIMSIIPVELVSDNEQ